MVVSGRLWRQIPPSVSLGLNCGTVQLEKDQNPTLGPGLDLQHGLRSV